MPGSTNLFPENVRPLRDNDSLQHIHFRALLYFWAEMEKVWTCKQCLCRILVDLVKYLKDFPTGPIQLFWTSFKRNICPPKKKMVLVLLSALVERFSVACMRDFFWNMKSWGNFEPHSQIFHIYNIFFLKFIIRRIIRFFYNHTIINNKICMVLKQFWFL